MNVAHYVTGPGRCACGEESNNVWTMAAHLRQTSTTNAYTTVFPSTDDEPTYFIKESDQVTSGLVVSLQFDSIGRHSLAPPTADYLDRLAAQATALADRMRELAAGGAA